MVSGFLTSPCDHSRIFSGDASEIRIALNESGSLGFSKKLKMSRIGFFLLSLGETQLLTKSVGSRGRGGEEGYSSAAWSFRSCDGSMSSTFRHKAWSSLMRTLKLSGRPG